MSFIVPPLPTISCICGARPVFECIVSIVDATSKSFNLLKGAELLVFSTVVIVISVGRSSVFIFADCDTLRDALNFFDFLRTCHGEIYQWDRQSSADSWQ